MKRAALFAFMLVSSALFSATEPDFANIKGFPAEDVRRHFSYPHTAGVTDDTSAFTSAIASATASGRYAIYIPNGAYRVNGTITVPSYVQVIGAPSSSEGITTTINFYPSVATMSLFDCSNSRGVGLSNFNVFVQSPCQKVIKLTDTGYSQFKNFLINGDFLYAVWHEHAGTAGYYNRFDDIRVVGASASTYLNPVGMYFKGYASNLLLSHCSVTGASTAVTLEYGNAVTFDTCAFENAAVQGVSIGSSSAGVVFNGTYFENCPRYKSIVVDTGASNIYIQHVRTGFNLEESYTYNKDGFGVKIDGGLRSLYQGLGVENFIENGSGEDVTTGGIFGWTNGNATPSREVSNTGGYPAAMRVTSHSGASTAYVSTSVLDSTRLGSGKALTLHGCFYAPVANTMFPRVDVYDKNGVVVTSKIFDVFDSWVPFGISWSASDASAPYSIRVFSSSAGPAAGTEYVLVSGLTCNAGDNYYPQLPQKRRTFNSTPSISEREVRDAIHFCGYATINIGTTTAVLNFPASFTFTTLLGHQVTNNSTFDTIVPNLGFTSVTLTASATSGVARDIYYDIWAK